MNYYVAATSSMEEINSAYESLDNSFRVNANKWHEAFEQIESFAVLARDSQKRDLLIALTYIFHMMGPLLTFQRQYASASGSEAKKREKRKRALCQLASADTKYWVPMAPCTFVISEDRAVLAEALGTLHIEDNFLQHLVGIDYGALYFATALHGALLKCS